MSVYKKLRFRYHKDEGNRHYAWLMPLDEFTGRVVTIGWDPVWLDGQEIFGVIGLYNGRECNRKKEVG